QRAPLAPISAVRRSVASRATREPSRSRVPRYCALSTHRGTSMPAARAEAEAGADYEPLEPGPARHATAIRCGVYPDSGWPSGRVEHLIEQARFLRIVLTAQQVLVRTERILLGRYRTDRPDDAILPCQPLLRCRVQFAALSPELSSEPLAQAGIVAVEAF